MLISKNQKFVIWLWPNELIEAQLINCYSSIWPRGPWLDYVLKLALLVIVVFRELGVEDWVNATRRSQNWRGVTVSGAKVDPGSAQTLLLFTFLWTRKNAFRKILCLLFKNILLFQNAVSKKWRSVFDSNILKKKEYANFGISTKAREKNWAFRTVRTLALEYYPCRVSFAGVLLKSPLLTPCVVLQDRKLALWWNVSRS